MRAPGASVARTCQTSFTLVRPRRLTEGSGEKKARKPVGWRAREWRRMLDQGVYKSQSALARGEGVSTAAVSVALKGVR